MFVNLRRRIFWWLHDALFSWEIYYLYIIQAESIHARNQQFREEQERTKKEWGIK